MGSTIAYLAQSRLYIREADAEPREIVSQFTEKANERARRDSERHGWKSRAADGPMMFSSSILWRNKQATEISSIQITSVAPGVENEILFTLNTNSVGGLFAHNPADRPERRLYHKNGFNGRNLARHPTKDLVALCVEGSQLEAHIAITDTQGHALREITEGDSRDECPSWVPSEEKCLVFQSAGIGRDARGMQTGIGPYRIERLDLDSGKMSTLVEDDRFDHLSPRVASTGDLYFIRRPWTGQGNPVSLKALVGDILLFPYRLLRAILHFCNFFSTMFSGKPLMTSGGPPQPPQHATTLLLWGKVIDAEQAMKAMKTTGAAGLVPASWQLVREKKNGNQEVLAKSVLSFDLRSDGAIVHTNGISIFEQDPAGKSQTLCAAKMIEYVTCW